MTDFIPTSHIKTHWNDLKKIFEKIPCYNTENLILELIKNNRKNTKLINELKKLTKVLNYPKKYNQNHCFDKYLYKFKNNPEIKKFIVAKFEQSGGTFELCLFSYFTVRIQNNINVICLMNFNNQKEQLQERFGMFNDYLQDNGIKPLKVKYIRDFKSRDSLQDMEDVDIIVCLYNQSSMKKTFEKVCSIAHISQRNISFSYDEIDIPESGSERSRLKQVHQDILKYHPRLIKVVFGVSATTLGDIPGGFLEPNISDIVFKKPNDSWSGIGHPDVKLYCIDDENKDNLVTLIRNISKKAVKKDKKFIGNLYIDVRNSFQERYALELSHMTDLVVIVYNGTTSSEGGKFTIFNNPEYIHVRQNTKKDDYNLAKCFELIQKCLENKTRNKFIFINHNMVLRGISIKSKTLSITDEIIFKIDNDVASASQKYQRIAGLDMEPRRVYGLRPLLEDILQYQKHQCEIYMKCEIESENTPNLKLSEFVNSQNIEGKYNKKLSRNPTTKTLKSTGLIPISFNITRHVNTIKNRTDLIPIIKKNLNHNIFKECDVSKWEKVIKYIEKDLVNKNQSFILDKHAKSIMDKHWVLHYNNMIKNKGSCFSAGTDTHSKTSKCYIGIMKNKNYPGYGKCMVVFTDKKKKQIIKVNRD